MGSSKGLFRAPNVRVGVAAVVMAFVMVTGFIPAANAEPVAFPQALAPGSAVPTATLEPPSSIAVPARSIAFNGDGSRAFAAGRDKFHAIDVASDTVVASVDVPGAGDMVLSRDETTAFVAAGIGIPNVTIIDVASMRVTGAVPMEKAGKLAVSPDGATVYVSDESIAAGSVVVIDVAARKIKTVLPVGSGPGRPVIVADGAKVYVPNLFDDTVTVINAATNTVSKTVPVPVGVYGGALSADGSRVYFTFSSTQESGLSVMSVATDALVGTIRTTSEPSLPALTPDGKTGYAVDQEPGRYVNGRFEAGAYFVVTLDLVNNTSTALENGYAGRDKPVVRVSVDGTRLYIVGTFAVVRALPSQKFLGTEFMGENPENFTLEPGGSKGYGTFIDGNRILVLRAPVIEHIRKDYNSDGATDVLARDGNGALWLYPGNANTGWLPRKQVGSGWNVMNLIATPGDFNGDHLPDILARDGVGDLWLYPGNGASDWLPRSKVGTGWNSMTAVVTPGDFNFDGKTDIVARDGAGDLWLYPGDGTGGWLPRTRIGTGWNEMTAILGPGNTNEAGNDILARDRAGTLWLYQRTTAGEWRSRMLVGIEWNGMTAMVTPGDFDSDDQPDLLARDGTGNLWLYPGRPSGGYLPRVLVGVGWNVMTVIA